MTFLRQEVEQAGALQDSLSGSMLPGWGLLTLGVDQAAAAIILIGAGGVVLHSNPAAAAALDRGKILHLRSGRLHLNRKDERAAFRDAIDVAIRAAADGDRQTAVMVVLHNRQDCPVMALHLRSVVAPGLPPLASVRVADMLTPAGIEPAWIAGLLGLTQAEARVAAGLFDGLDLREIADRQKVALETIRGHLKRGMVKVGARSQAQLVRMVAAGHGIIDAAMAAHPPAKARAARRG